jgi:UDP-N-acetylglucosamine transferase subunit ALG13
MIFATVGTELPFDRMMRVVDLWAADNRHDIFAQIGDTRWRPRHMHYSLFLEPHEFARRFASATAIISHAGMGTILSALRYEKPLLVMPRRASLGEQRNEHQLATARRLSEMGAISVAFDEVSLRFQLDHLDQLQADNHRISAFAGADLISGIRRFIFSDQPQ